MTSAVDKINLAFGKPLFSTQPLWKESALLLANRMELKLEDKTKWEAAYRRYYYDKYGFYGTYDRPPYSWRSRLLCGSLC